MQSAQGLGVSPRRYELQRVYNILFEIAAYVYRKVGMDNSLHTDAADSVAALAPFSVISIVRPASEYPCLRSRSAAALESTPPLISTTAFLQGEFFQPEISVRDVLLQRTSFRYFTSKAGRQDSGMSILQVAVIFHFPIYYCPAYQYTWEVPLLPRDHVESLLINVKENGGIKTVPFLACRKIASDFGMKPRDVETAALKTAFVLKDTEETSVR